MDEDLKQFWSDDAQHYGDFVRRGYEKDKERKAWESLYAEVLEGCGKKALDCGCGPGTASMRLTDLGFQVLGLDYSPQMLEQARGNAERYGLKIDFVEGDAENLQFEDNTFDVIVSQYMLWTVPHPEKVLSEWYRVLRPGGRLAYIDGDWMDYSRDTFLRRKTMKFFKLFEYPKIKNKMIPTTDRRSPQSKGLWSANAIRPRDDLKMLETAGFVNIVLKDNIAKRVMPGVRYYANALTHDYFMMVADKPKEDSTE